MGETASLTVCLCHAGAACGTGDDQGEDGGGEGSGPGAHVHQGGELPGPGGAQGGAAQPEIRHHRATHFLWAGRTHER